jgi:isoquinoline 1-oxidoreductase
MTDRWDVEPERYELHEPPRYQFEIDRRGFLQLLSVLGGGLLVVGASEPSADQESGRAGSGGGSPADLTSWLHISPQGRVTVFSGKVEIGQNVRTSLAQAVGDELGVPMSAITFVLGDTDLTPFDQGTFGSRSTPAMAPILARAAATARELLMDRAAARWRVSRAQVSVADGRVRATDGRAAAYGELVTDAALTGVVAANVSLTPRAGWSLRGTAVPKVNGWAMVSGRHTFTPDLARPGLRLGRVIRPPAYGATPRAVEAGAARAIPGVQVVVDGDFVGVIAPTERALARAVSAVRVEWTTAPGQPSSATIYAHLKATARSAAGPGGGRGAGTSAAGDVAAARAGARRTLTASYRIPYIAHVPLEPRAAVAEWAGGRLTVWTGTQRPFGVRAELAQALRLDEDRVRVIVPDTGSGYGGKHTGTHAIEAARLARAAGAPVKLVYTRAEEFMWGYFRPAGVIDVSASLDAEGRLVAWEFDNVNSGSSGLRTPYTVPNRREAFHPSDSPLPQGSYRGLAATANHYAREMHMDAAARAAGTDAVAFRRAHLDEPRLIAVLDAAAERSGWPRPSASGRALGIACGTEKGSYVATAAEVSVAGRGVIVHRLVVAFECGAIVNPDGLNNQVEGAVVQGLGGALFEAAEFAEGRILNGTMARYRVPRFRDVPPLDVILLDRPDLPSAGAGETPIVCVAPAIGSALRSFGDVDTALPVRLAQR